MSETKPSAGSELGAEQVTDVSGGITCSPDDIDKIIAGLRENYDRLVDFTSYVIERMNGGSSRP